MATKRAAKFTAEQVKEHTKRIQEIVEAEKGRIKKGDNFTAITPTELEVKFKRVNSPMIVWQSWTGAVAPGGTIGYNVGIYNPDPVQAIWLFGHVWVGSGNVDPVVGTFLSNVDDRFPRLTQPAFAGLNIPAGGSSSLSYALKVPSTAEKTNYLGNTLLMQSTWHDVGLYLDRALFVFGVV